MQRSWGAKWVLATRWKKKRRKDPKPEIQPAQTRRRKKAGSQGISSFTLATAPGNLFVAKRSQPEAFAENVRFDLEGVLGAGLEKAKEVFDNRGRHVIAVKVDEALAINWGCVNEWRLLRIVNEIAGVDT